MFLRQSIHLCMQVFSVQMTHGADSNTWTKHDLSDVSLILPFQFPSQCCVCYVMSHPTLAWPHRRWVMSESALSWLHRKAFVRFLFHWTIFRMRQEALSLSLISEEMEGLTCRCNCHLWNTVCTIGKCLKITKSVLYFHVNHQCFRVVFYFSE